MEPTDNAIHAGCLGNVNATWTFHGRSGHSARPWLADNAIHARRARASPRWPRIEPREHEFDGLAFREVASVTQIAGGIAGNVIPDRASCHVNYRYAPGRVAGRRRGAAARALRRHGELRDRLQRAVRRRRDGNPLVRAAGRGRRPRASRPSRRGRRSRSSRSAGLDAVNFGPGDPAQAHRRDEQVAVAALVRSYERAGARSRGMRLSPVLAGLRAYPFVRLTEAQAARWRPRGVE